MKVRVGFPTAVSLIRFSPPQSAAVRWYDPFALGIPAGALAEALSSFDLRLLGASWGQEMPAESGCATVAARSDPRISFRTRRITSKAEHQDRDYSGASDTLAAAVYAASPESFALAKDEAGSGFIAALSVRVDEHAEGDYRPAPLLVSEGEPDEGPDDDDASQLLHVLQLLQKLGAVVHVARGETCDGAALILHHEDMNTLIYQGLEVISFLSGLASGERAHPEGLLSSSDMGLLKQARPCLKRLQKFLIAARPLHFNRTRDVGKWRSAAQSNIWRVVLVDIETRDSIDAICSALGGKPIGALVQGLHELPVAQWDRLLATHLGAYASAEGLRPPAPATAESLFKLLREQIDLSAVDNSPDANTLLDLLLSYACVESFDALQHCVNACFDNDEALSNAWWQRLMNQSVAKPNAPSWLSRLLQSSNLLQNGMGVTDLCQTFARSGIRLTLDEVSLQDMQSLLVQKQPVASLYDLLVSVAVTLLHFPEGTQELRDELARESIKVNAPLTLYRLIKAGVPFDTRYDAFGSIGSHVCFLAHEALADLAGDASAREELARELEDTQPRLHALSAYMNLYEQVCRDDERELYRRDAAALAYVLFSLVLPSEAEQRMNIDTMREIDERALYSEEAFGFQRLLKSARAQVKAHAEA